MADNEYMGSSIAEWIVLMDEGKIRILLAKKKASSTKNNETVRMQKEWQRGQSEEMPEEEHIDDLQPEREILSEFVIWIKLSGNHYAVLKPIQVRHS